MAHDHHDHDHDHSHDQPRSRSCGSSGDGRAPFTGLGLRNKTRLDAEFGEVLEQLDGAAEDALRTDHMVAGLQQGQDGHQDGRHAAGRGDTAGGAFQRGQAPLHHGHGGV